MAQTGYTPILIYGSTTASNAPSASNLTTSPNGVELAVNAADGKLFYKDSGGVVQVLASTARTAGNFGDLTGSITVAKGTTAQQPASPVTGMIRYNTTTNQFEGYAGASPSWLPVGGSVLSNDTTTASNLYPVFANATSGTATTVYTSNAKYLYKPSTGELQSSVMVSANGMSVNSNTVSVSYTVAAGQNALSAGPVTVADGITVTVSSGSVWTVV